MEYIVASKFGADCPKTKLKTRKTTTYSMEKAGKTPDIVCAIDENRVFGQPAGECNASNCNETSGLSEAKGL